MSTIYRLLGPVEVVRDDVPIELGGPKQRAVLAVLLLEAGRVVSTDRLVDVVWGETHPPSVSASLQAFISNLRRVLRHEDAVTSPIVRRSPGYVVQVDPADLDLTVFARRCDAAQQAIEESRWQDAVTAAEAALALDRGPLLEEYADEEWVQLASVAHDERRAALVQNLVVGLLGLRRTSAALARSTGMVAEQPLDERAHWLHVVALHQAGRSPEALEAYADLARRLDEELGLEPGPALRDLQGAVLRQDESITSWPLAPGETVADTVPAVVEPLAAPAAAPAPAEESGQRLVGRVRELAALESALREGPGSAAYAVVSGPAGIGKSRLVEELAARWAREGGRVVRAGCLDDDGAPPWWPVRQVLRDLGADPDATLLPPDGVDADVSRFLVYDRVSDLLASAADGTRLLVVVEDVHWADPATIRFLTHLADTPGAPGLAVVLTTRTGVAERDLQRLLATIARRRGARQLGLPPLARSEVATLAADVSGGALDETEIAQLADRTGGNPFFVTEYARLPADERRAGEVPLAIRSVLGRRLAGLDSGVVEVLRAAAVIGEVLDIDLLAAATRLDREELADLLDEAADAHVIAAAPGSGAYTFAHALLREEVASGLSDIRRQRLHLRVAAAIGPGGGSEQLTRRAGHLVSALPLSDARDVLAACREAAVDAESRWQSDSAARWWQQAVAAWDLTGSDHDDERDDLVVAQVAALARAGRGQTVLDVVDEALFDAVRRDRLATAGLMAATLLRTSGSWPWATYGEDPGPVLARLAGVEPLVTADPAAHVRVLAALAVGSCYDPDPAVPDGLSARAIAEAEAIGDEETLADALLGRALTFAGVAVRAAESVELLDRAEGLAGRFERMDGVIAQGLYFMAKASLGDPAAFEHAQRGAAGSDLLRLPVTRVQFRWVEGVAAQWRGRTLEQADAIYRHAYDLHQETELYSSGVFFLALVGLRWEQGRLHEASELDHADPQMVPWAAAVVSAARGEPRAASLLREEVERPEPPVWTSHGRLTMLAHAVADLGLADLVAPLRERLEPLEDMVAIIGEVGVSGPVALALARLDLLAGDLDAAQRHLRLTEELAARVQGGHWLVRSRLVGAQLDLARSSTLDTAAVARLAEEAEARGMTGVARDARALLAG